MKKKVEEKRERSRPFHWIGRAVVYRETIEKIVNILMDGQEASRKVMLKTSEYEYDNVDEFFRDESGDMDKLEIYSDNPHIHVRMDDDSITVQTRSSDTEAYGLYHKVKENIVACKKSQWLPSVSNLTTIPLFAASAGALLFFVWQNANPLTVGSALQALVTSFVSIVLLIVLSIVFDVAILKPLLAKIGLENRPVRIYASSKSEILANRGSGWKDKLDKLLPFVSHIIAAILGGWALAFFGA